MCNNTCNTQTGHHNRQLVTAANRVLQILPLLGRQRVVSCMFVMLAGHGPLLQYIHADAQKEMVGSSVYLLSGADKFQIGVKI